MTTSATARRKAWSASAGSATWLSSTRCVTNVSMGTEIDGVVEFEDLAERGLDAPTAIALLD